MILLRHKGVIGDDIDDLNGLIQRNPGAAILMLIFLLSLRVFRLQPVSSRSCWYSGRSSRRATTSSRFSLSPTFSRPFIITSVWSRRLGEGFNRPRDTNHFVGQKFALAAMVIVTLVAGMFPEQFLLLAKYSILAPFTR